MTLKDKLYFGIVGLMILFMLVVLIYALFFETPRAEVFQSMPTSAGGG